MRIQIRGGTPQSGKTLCLQCKHATVVRGQNNQEIIFCDILFKSARAGFGGYGAVPFKIAECAKFHPMNMPWKHEMEQMAWHIEARKRGTTGFQPESPEPPEMEIVITPPGGDDDDSE